MTHDPSFECYCKDLISKQRSTKCYAMDERFMKVSYRKWQYQEIVMQSVPCHRPCRSDSCNRRRIWTPMVELVSTFWPNPHGQELRQEGISSYLISCNFNWMSKNVFNLQTCFQHRSASSIKPFWRHPPARCCRQPHRKRGQGAAKDYFSEQVHADSGIYQKHRSSLVNPHQPHSQRISTSFKSSILWRVGLIGYARS